MNFSRRTFTIALAAATLAAPAASAAPAHHKADYTFSHSKRVASCEIQLQQPLPMPKPKANGRGAALESQIPQYARSYESDPYLAAAVVAYRQWQWTDMYTSLDAKAQERPDYLDTYRLQADAYQVNSTYPEALSQLDQILRRSPNDVHALASSSLIQYFQGNTEDYRCRMSRLAAVAPKAAHDMQKFIAFAKESMYSYYGSEPRTNMKPDVIAVFGQSPNADGTPSAGLLTRLVKAKEMADRYPDAQIVLSGAAVRTPYAEADVMAKWLIEQGVDPTRIIKDDRARDTVGNSMGMLEIFKENHWNKVLAVGTIQHLPRAVTTLKAMSQQQHYHLQIDAAGGGTRPEESTQVGERKYTYVTAARAAGLFEKDDFAKYATKGR